MTTRRIFLALPILFLGWIAVLLLVMRFTDAAPGAVVLFPGHGLMNNLPNNISILAATPLSITLESQLPDLASRLYAAGAIAVLPAGLPGCLPLPDH